MLTKGNVRRITSKTPYNKSNKAVKKENTRERKSGSSPKRFSGDRPFPCAFEFRFCCFVCGGCLNGEA